MTKKQDHDCREELHAAGSRATPGRLALLAVLERERKPMTVHELQHKLPSLNQVTLYRALDALVDAGLVYRGESARVTHYEYAKRPHHHHLVCADCGYTKACTTC
ncbi:MAG TPA: transcriptional repressor [Candidatus Paceibacterota bacterium]|nr:transcriptional repressor [Candidatus Paceibacterota bacterium]